MIIIYFYKGIKPIKDYIINEIMKNEFINNSKNLLKKGNIKLKKKKNKSINNTKIENKKKLKFPPKKKKINSSSIINLKKSERDITYSINDKKN